MKYIFLVGLAACGTSDSTALLTKGITPEITASTKGDGTTTVSAELFEGSPLQLIFVDLNADDELVASIGGMSKTLVQSRLLNIISYSATFSTGNAGDTFVVDFQRTLDDGAPASTATLPEPFTLDAVPATASRAQDLLVTWGPTGPAMVRWEVTGDCIQTANGNAPSDTGAVTIPANAIMSANTATTSCAVTLSISRVLPGVLDPHYRDGGQIFGEQVRTAMFTSTP